MTSLTDLLSYGYYVVTDHEDVIANFFIRYVEATVFVNKNNRSGWYINHPIKDMNYSLIQYAPNMKQRRIACIEIIRELTKSYDDYQVIERYIREDKRDIDIYWIDQHIDNFDAKTNLGKLYYHLKMGDINSLLKYQRHGEEFIDYPYINWIIEEICCLSPSQVSNLPMDETTIKLAKGINPMAGELGILADRFEELGWFETGHPILSWMKRPLHHKDNYILQAYNW